MSSSPNPYVMDLPSKLAMSSPELECVPGKGALFSPVKIRAGKLSLQPEVLGAGQEATNGLKHFEKRPLQGGQRTVRVAT